MKNADVWFVIVTYKPDRVVLRRLLDALEGWPVEVVDNTQKNLGFGAAANRGMKNAFAAGAEWVVVMNQDIEVSRKGIAHFCALARKCDPGIVGPEAGSLDPKRWTTILYKNASELHKATPCKSQGSGLGELEYISGSCMAIHRNVWESVGGFYEPYFMYYEDADLCARAGKAGYPLRKGEIEGFKHEAAKNVNDDGITKEYYLARNHLLFVRRLTPLSVKVHELLRLPKTLTEHYQVGNTGAIMGIRDFAMGRSGEYRRR